MPAVSVGAGLVAASLKPGARVLMPEDEFRYLLFPFLAAQRAFGVQVRRVAFDQLAGAVDEGTDLVVTSHVRSQDGRVRTSRFCRRRRKESVHACSSTPPTQRASSNHLALRRESTTWWRRRTSISSVHAAWRSCEPAGVAVTSCTRSRRRWRSARSPYLTYFGGELSDLADGAARFDVSLAWHPWLGARASLSLLAGVPTEKRERWSVGLATAPRTGALPTGDRVVIPFRSSGREPSHAGGEARGEANVKAAIQRRRHPCLVPRLQHPGRRRSGRERPCAPASVGLGERSRSEGQVHGCTGYPQEPDPLRRTVAV